MIIAASAKINLYLRVLSKREDGYHEIETLFERVSIFDSISIELAASSTTITCDNPNVPTDDDSLMARTVAAFLEDIPRQIEALKGYLEAGDAPSAERQAHSIKGASANVSGEALREVASEMEKAGKAADLDAAKAGMPKLEAQFEKFKETINQTTRNRGATDG